MRLDITNPMSMSGVCDDSIPGGSNVCSFLCLSLLSIMFLCTPVTRTRPPSTSGSSTLCTRTAVESSDTVVSLWKPV